jgi:hypothetical protein
MPKTFIDTLYTYKEVSVDVSTPDIEAIAENLMSTAVEHLIDGDGLAPVHFILSDRGLATIPMVDKRLTPRMMHPIVCRIAEQLNAHAIYFVMEAWMIDEREKDPDKPIREHDNKGEMIVVTMATRQEEKALLSPFTRPGEGIIEVEKPRWTPSLLPLFEPFWRNHENAEKAH